MKEYFAEQKVELYIKRLKDTNTAKKASNAWKKQVNKILEIGNIIYVKNAWYIVQDRLEFIEKRKRKQGMGFSKTVLTSVTDLLQI